MNYLSKVLIKAQVTAVIKKEILRRFEWYFDHNGHQSEQFIELIYYYYYYY